jgi:mRNA interferase RelE/StbE
VTGRYRIQILPSAARQVEGLPRQARAPVRDAIDALAEEPRPFGYDVLSGAPKERIHRIRVGNYRILYQVFDKHLVVLVVRVADRREVYGDKFLRRLRRQLRDSLR